ncbi:MAG: hypothetical protein ACPGVL_11450 [Pseudoalteromonas spongiae]
MRDAIILLTIMLLVGCGGSSSKKPPQVVNSAPQLTLESAYTAQSGAILTIEHQVADPENDTVSLTWSNDINQVTITQSTLAITSVQLPTVTTETTLTLTLTARDDKNATTSQDITVTIKPKSAQVTFDLLDAYSAKENSYFELTTQIEANHVISDISWQLDEPLNADVNVQNSLNGTLATSSLTLLTPDVTQTQSFNAIISVTANGQLSQKHTRITINPDTSDFLSISLPERYVIDEGKDASISVTINSSDSQSEIQWRWHNSEIALTGDTSKTVSFNAPQVDSDQTLILEVSVTSANQTHIAEIPVTIKDVTVYSNISLAANRTLAVKGHAVFVDVITENPEQISSINWTVNNLTEQDYNAKDHRLNITVPEVSSGFFIDLEAQATLTLTNGNQQTLTQSIRVLNPYTLDTELNIGHNIDRPLPVYNGETGNFTLSVSNAYDLIDSVAIDLPFTVTPFATQNAELINNTIQLALLSDNITTEAETTLQVTAFVGDYQVNDYFKLRLKPSHFTIYPGLTEQFYAGSHIKLFNQIYHDDTLREETAQWQTHTSIGDIVQSDGDEFSYASSPSFHGEISLNASFNQNESTTQSDKLINMYRTLRIDKDDISCSVSGRSTVCVYDGRTIRFTLDTAQLRQLKLNDEVACLLTQNSAVECIGNSANPIVSNTPTLSGEIERLNMVGNNAACVQFKNAQWQCWGQNAANITSLTSAFSHVYTITQHKQNTCLVADGFLHCFNQVGEQSFNDLTGFIKDIEIKSSGLCYQYTHQKTSSWQCPSELK